jgi:hypothetical protein
MLPKIWTWERVAFVVFATFAVYVAVEPMLASSDDCIDALEIFVFLPYYALLYFGTLPALIGFGIWRVARGDAMSRQSRRTLEVSIGVLGVLLLLEILAWVPSPYLTLANRSLDFMPSIVLLLWAAKFWLSLRAVQDAPS